jgi:hypothetical protein
MKVQSLAGVSALQLTLLPMGFDNSDMGMKLGARLRHLPLL